MENKEKEIPFPEVLDQLFDEATPKVSLLFRLSDLETADFGLFQARWLLADVEQRGVLARHLADLVEDDFVLDFSPIFSFFLDDEATAVRHAGLDGLWDATDLSLLPQIIEMMKHDEETAVRAAAASTLAHYVLLSEWGQLPAHISDKIVAELLVAYEQPGTPTSVRRAALEAMASANHPRIATLIEEAYQESDIYMQLSAVFAMGSSADSRWLPVVLQEMESHLAEMRAEAARAAGHIGSSDAIAELADLAIDPDEDVALAAINALGQIGGEEATRILTDLAEDPDAEALQEAIFDAIEEMSWLSGDFNLLALQDDDEEDEDDGMGIFSKN
ncbi:MAG: HEAT repeat domain-containing protein [Chloroflexota bacterium]